MSDDIPVGSPPVPPGRHAAPLGWYPDPSDPSRERYWDGWQWNRSTRPAVGSAGPVGAPPGQPAAYSPGNIGNTGGTSTGTSVPTTADGVPLASWGVRAGAAIIDAVLLWFLGLLVVGSIQRATGADVRLEAAAQRYQAYVFESLSNPEAFDAMHALSIILTRDFYVQIALYLAVGVLFFTIFHAALSATPGKLMLGLRVVPVDRGTQTQGLAWGRSFVRALVYQILARFSVLVWLVLLLDLLWPLWDKRRQSLHDKVAGTQVVNVKQGAQHPQGMMDSTRQTR